MRKNNRKSMIALSLVCAGVLMVSPISSAILNNSNNKKIESRQEVATKNKANISDKTNKKEEKVLTEKNDKNNYAVNKNYKEDLNYESKEKQVNSNIQNTKNKNSNAYNKNDQAVLKNDKNDQTEVKSQKEQVLENKIDKQNEKIAKKDMTVDQARDILKEKNNKVDYDYMGTADDYKALKDQGRKGQVFLPNVPTDIGYYVDEDGQVYYFHPSGYLEKAK